VDRETALDRLAAVPLEDFVAERKRLAKELRGAGDRDAAAEVAKLPKPTPPAWALNHLAREDPAALDQWLAAAEALRHASTHAAEVGGDELRAAMAAHRDATRSLLGAVRDRVPLSDPMQERVRALLQAATADPEVAARLRSGRIVEGAAESDAPPAAEPAPAPAIPKRRPGRESDEQRAARERAEAEARAAAEERAAQARADLERRAGAASAELERLRDVAAERETAAAAAEERLEEARRTLTRSESELSAARSAQDDARAAVADAEREVRTLIAQLRGAS
jgi:hypothetical protein